MFIILLFISSFIYCLVLLIMLTEVLKFPTIIAELSINIFTFVFLLHIFWDSDISCIYAYKCYIFKGIKLYQCKMSFFFFDNWFVLHSLLCDINIVTLDLFWSLLVWNIFFHPFTFHLFVFFIADTTTDVICVFGSKMYLL